jgi:tetratricopeptide (TPR) repeat protein
MLDTPTQMRIFISHSSSDNAVCDQLVTTLRGSGADVWYDEHNLGAGTLRREIMKELSARPVTLVLLSKAALASDWVQDECEWAYNLSKRKPERLILPVVVGAYDPDDFDSLLYLESMTRVEGPDHQPYPIVDTIARTLRLLALTPAGEAPVSIVPQPAETLNDLLTQGRGLFAQARFAEALPFFERATQTHDGVTSCEAWASLGRTYNGLGRYVDALAAVERAIAIDQRYAPGWYGRGVGLDLLGRPEEALVAYDRALALDPAFAEAWRNKASMLSDLGHSEEALAAYEQALACDPEYANAWNGKGNALHGLGRYTEALAAYEQALAINPRLPMAWNNRGDALRLLQQYDDAMRAVDRALALDPNNVVFWTTKGEVLNDVGHFDAALLYLDRALSLDVEFRAAWEAKAVVLRALGELTQAEEAERRAQALGG